jgi:hypothetical protein
METTDVVVIGAGPAGLATGACLGNVGANFIILEKEQAVGSSWRRHYERLHLHTVKQLSSLPYAPFPKEYPRYVPRQQVVDYLDAYAGKFGLKPRFGETVRQVHRDGTDWAVETSWSSLRARYVVVASGFNATPTNPSLPELQNFTGAIVHSSQYKSGKPLAGQSVLVIGMGNTGAEIALDLFECGARPTISLRNGVHIVPRDLFGIPIQVAATLATSVLPTTVNDVVFPHVCDLALGYPSKVGIRRPQRGILEQINRSAKIPVIDVGTVRKIRDGAIKMAPGLASADGNKIAFKDGRSAVFDAVVIATGYRPNYPDFLLVGDLGGDGEVPPKPNAQNAGLYFVGYRNVVTGLLREIGKEAQAVAKDIAHKGIKGVAKPN